MSSGKGKIAFSKWSFTQYINKLQDGLQTQEKLVNTKRLNAVGIFFLVGGYFLVWFDLLQFGWFEFLVIFVLHFFNLFICLGFSLWFGFFFFREGEH